MIAIPRDREPRMTALGTFLNLEKSSVTVSSIVRNNADSSNAYVRRPIAAAFT